MADELRLYQEKLDKTKKEALIAVRVEAYKKQAAHDAIEAAAAEAAADIDREAEKQRDLKESATNMANEVDSEEERADKELAEHLEYVAQFRFQREYKNKLAAAAAAEAAAEAKAAQQQQARMDLEAVRQRLLEADAESRKKKAHDKELLRQKEVQKQARERPQIDLEYEQQKKEQRMRIANVRGNVLKKGHEGTVYRRERVETQQGSRRRETVTQRREREFTEPMLEEPNEPLDDESYDSDASQQERDENLFYGTDGRGRGKFCIKGEQ